MTAMVVTVLELTQVVVVLSQNVVMDTAMVMKPMKHAHPTVMHLVKVVKIVKLTGLPMAVNAVIVPGMSLASIVLH